MATDPVSRYDEDIIKGARDLDNWARSLQVYLEICTHCGVCSQVCHVYQSNPDRRASPAKRSDLLRSLYHSQATPLGRLFKRYRLTESDFNNWALDFYKCSGCRRCAQYCPLGIDNSVITRKARAILHALGKSPQRLVATQNLIDTFSNDLGMTYEAFLDAVGFLEQEIRDEKGVEVAIPVDQEADFLFVPPGSDLMTAAETLMGCALFFHAAGLRWTMSSKAFDGSNYGLFTGDEAYTRRKNKVLYDACIELKVKTLVMGECGHAYRVAKRLMPFFWGTLPFQVVSIFTLAEPYIRKGAIQLDPSANPMLVTYHDPCNYTRSCGMVEEPRTVLKACVENFVEMTPNRYENWCCGGGGGLAILDGREGLSAMNGSFHDYRVHIGGKKKLEQVKRTGADYVAAPCANCKRQLGLLMQYHGMDVQVGGIFDLLGNAAILNH